ncbi:MAG TPA: hypothetical protein PLE45_08455 [Spirochaetota bacterium]|nr:hypothetical protein [Spirochaetota bacterium]HOL57167.1 hypothetical protein [Spirochaetota bacterium]HPP04775.1 hypothetical protein [Spirochaetota bacterium]
MKKCFLLLFFLLIYCYIFSQDNYKKDAKFLYEMFYPADEGSNNQERLINYILTYLKNINVPYNIYDIEIEPEFYTRSKNIEVFLKAKENTDETIVILTSLNTPIIDNKYFDNSISIEITLNLIDFFSKIDLKKNILFGFIGSIGKDDYPKYGFTRLLNLSENPYNYIVTFIDILTIDSNVYFTGSMNKKPLPSILVNIFDKVNKEKTFLFDSFEIKKAKLNLLPSRQYSDIFNQKEILAVEFSNRNKNLYNVFYYNSEKCNKYTLFFIEWIKSLNNLNFKFQREYNYLYEDIFGYKLFIKEKNLLIIFLFLIFITLFTRLFFPNFERLRISTILKLLPYFIFLFLCYFLLSFLPVILLTPLNFFYNIQKSYLNIPVLYFFVIFFISFLIIILIIDLFKKIPLPKHSYIYIIGAILFSYVNLILLALFDISFAYIFIWAIIFITLSNFTGRNYLLKFILYFISSIPFIKFIFDITYMGNINIIKNLFKNLFIYNLIFCLISFPFMFLSIRFFLIIKNYLKFSLSKRKILFFFIIFLFLFTLLFAFISIRFYSEEQKIEAKLVMDYKKNRSYLDINSSSILGEFSYEINNSINKIMTKNKNIRIPVNKPENEYNIKYNVYKFYDYNRYEIIIDSKDIIEFMDISIYLPYLSYIFNANYSFSSFDSDKEDLKRESIFQLKIPRNPGNKVVILFDTLKNISPRIEFVIKYFNPSDIKIYKQNSIIKYEKEFREEIISF